MFKDKHVIRTSKCEAFSEFSGILQKGVIQGFPVLALVSSQLIALKDFFPF